MLNSSLASWYFKRQPNIALLSIKAEKILLMLVVKNVMWIDLLFMKLGLL